MNYFSFAIRNIQKKKIRSWLTLIGICIGIAAVVSLISLGGALKLAINSQFGISSTELITIQAGGGDFGPPGYDVVKPLTKSDVRAVNSLGSVEFAFPRNIETISVEYNNKLIFRSALSVPEGYEKEFYDILNLEVESGRFLKSGDSKRVLIGSNLADGSRNEFDRAIVPGRRISILGEDFVVTGVLKKKGSFMVDGVVFIYDNELENLANYGDNVDIIAVKVRNKDLIERAKEEIGRLMRSRRGVKVGEENFRISTPEASLQQVNQILDTIQIFIIIIASISIIVGAVGIINTMTTSVLERRKEIGIMKSIGARNSQIFTQFFFESGFLGLIGGGLGVLLGISLGYIGTTALNSFIRISAAPQINFSLIFFSLIGSFLIGSLAGIFPAMRAARQNPIKALRN